MRALKHTIHTTEPVIMQGFDRRTGPLGLLLLRITLGMMFILHLY